MAKSKKDLSSSTAAINSTAKVEEEVQRTDTNKGSSEKTSKKGLKSWETRKTYIVDEDIADDLDAIAYWERKTIKDVINKALRNYVNEYVMDSKNKNYVITDRMQVKPIPKKE